MSARPTLVILKSDAIGSFNIPEWEKLCESHGWGILEVDPKTHDDLISKMNSVENVQILVTTWPATRSMGFYNAEVVARMPSTLKAVIHQGAGYDALGPISAWKERGIEAANAPNAVANATAETGMFLTLAATRYFQTWTSSLREGKWHGHGEAGHETSSRVLGIVGMGNIGKKFRDRALGFGYKEILYYNRRRLPAEEEKGCRYVSYDEILAQADILAFVLPYNSSTHHIYNKEAIAKSKDGVIIVNVARGPIIDEEELIAGLQSGKIASAGLDVYEKEPIVDQRLIDHPRSFLLPHAAALTHEVRENIELEVMDLAQSVMENGKLKSVVPEMRN